MALLDVRNLTVEIPTEDGVIHAVRDVSYTVEAGQFFGIVGESGSGKSVMVQALLGLVPGARISGEAWFDGRDLLAMSQRELQELRGRTISMIFQDPLSSLHPQYTIGWQITEQLHAHTRISKSAARVRAIELLEKVGIPDAAHRFDAYPHQFSGGMRQRVMIAMALSLNPRLIIADEPTTALDSTVQAQILELLHDLRDEFDTTVVMITHDLNVLGRIADTMLVMYAGHMLETGPAASVFGAPQHPYTAGLLRSSPNSVERGAALVPIPGRPPSLLNQVRGCIFADRCPDVSAICRTNAPPVRLYDNGIGSACWLEGAPSEPAAPADAVGEGHPLEAVEGSPLVRVRDVELSFHDRRAKRENHVLRGIDLTLRKGETLGLVGESGCGKSTLARVIAGLVPASSGTVELDGRLVHEMGRSEWREARQQVQLVFQDPFGALNPRRRVGAIIGDPLRLHGRGGAAIRKDRVRELMELVGLNPEHYNRYPAQFSGGQRQRIGIARALALNPSLIICDEPVSALDVSIQAQVLNLMGALQREFDLTYLFISHDLAVVRHICDRIAVMDQGRIIELGDTEDICERPETEFTRTLLAASAPVPRPTSSRTAQLLVGAAPRTERDGDDERGVA